MFSKLSFRLLWTILLTGQDAQLQFESIQILRLSRQQVQRLQPAREAPRRQKISIACWKIYPQVKDVCNARSQEIPNGNNGKSQCPVVKYFFGGLAEIRFLTTGYVPHMIYCKVYCNYIDSLPIMF